MSGVRSPLDALPIELLINIATYCVIAVPTDILKERELSKLLLVNRIFNEAVRRHLKYRSSDKSRPMQMLIQVLREGIIQANNDNITRALSTIERGCQAWLVAKGWNHINVDDTFQVECKEVELVQLVIQKWIQCLPSQIYTLKFTSTHLNLSLQGEGESNVFDVYSVLVIEALKSWKGRVWVDKREWPKVKILKAQLREAKIKKSNKANRRKKVVDKKKTSDCEETVDLDETNVLKQSTKANKPAAVSKIEAPNPEKKDAESNRTRKQKRQQFYRTSKKPAKPKRNTAPTTDTW